jgi:hypothetical protein
VSIDGFSGASSAVPREDSTAFSTQLEGTSSDFSAFQGENTWICTILSGNGQPRNTPCVLPHALHEHHRSLANGILQRLIVQLIIS